MRLGPRVSLRDIDRAGAGMKQFVEGMNAGGCAENHLQHLRHIVHALFDELELPKHIA